ncbi:MAG: ABC transporter permease [Deltaproteobacteria bacterium]|nr:ABC transporter permease [Deltaproteobacteria bacterium]MCB9478714.1 ABC transporter permease [Deltaproteobacteria bacterium]MCB9488230.1 ABC transporter permease [Deltaproteobacteria bacterium]
MKFGMWKRTWAMIVKEFIQLRRDRMSLGLMIFIPLLQLILFGYAINMNPHHLPTAVFARDHGTYARTFLSAMKATRYFDIVREVHSDEEIDELILSGKIQFAVEIPENFSRDLARGQRPQMLVIADATDPATIGGPISALRVLAGTALARDMAGPLRGGQGSQAPFELVVHQRYNPEEITSLNIVPGLLGTILTLTMVVFTALAVTRETERGTMENLLSMPIRPVEVMMGKIVPYILIGAVQFALILGAAHLLFNVPVTGSLLLLVALSTLFIVANLSIGYTFSTVARNQLQAVQMAIMFFLPSLLLSGFLFPFRGMPEWAQYIGSVLPLTHFTRIVRGIMLKGATFGDMVQEVVALGLFTLAALGVAVTRFRRTLD